MSQCLFPKYRSLLKALDPVSADYVNHQQEIFSKLVNIMQGLVKKTCIKLMKKFRENEGSSSIFKGIVKPTADPAIRTLINQTISLHNTLTLLLTAQQRNIIFKRILHV